MKYNDNNNVISSNKIKAIIITILMLLLTSVLSFISFVPKAFADDVTSSMQSIYRSAQFGSTTSSYSSGRNIAYDIYTETTQGKSGAFNTSAPTVTKAGYLQFQGWMTSLGKGNHHDADDSKLYVIVAESGATGNARVYSTTKTNRALSDDVNYGYGGYASKNGRGAGGTCEDTANDQTNIPAYSGGRISNGACNMKYKYSGFTVSIPIDSFASESFIESKIVGNKTSVDYTLHMLYIYNGPANPKEKVLRTEVNAIGDETIDFKFGKHDQYNIKMTNSRTKYVEVRTRTQVIKRLYPRTKTPAYTDGNDPLRRFPDGKKYKVSDVYTAGTHAESSAVYLAVVETNGTKFTRSAYSHGGLYSSSGNFTYDGTATLLRVTKNKDVCPDGTVVPKGTKCYADIKIKYIDNATGREIKAEHPVGKKEVFTKYKITDDLAPSVIPYKGTNYYEMANKNTSAKAQFTVEKGITLRLYYSTVDEIPEPITKPSSPNFGGTISWELKKSTTNTATKMELKNQMYRTSTHIAIDESKNRWSISGNGISGLSNQTAKISKTDGDPKNIKGGNATFTASYYYTDTQKPVYYCTGYFTSDDGTRYCSNYAISRYIPDWDYGTTASISETLALDHKYGEELVMDYTNNKWTKILVTGREMNVGSGNETVQRETFSLEQPKSTTLNTQEYLPIADNKMSYVNTRTLTFMPYLGGTKKHSGNTYPSMGATYVPDIDDTLKTEFKTPSTDVNKSLGDYKLTLTLDNVTKPTSGSYQFNIATEDAFYVTKSTGVLFAVPKNSTLTQVNNSIRTRYAQLVGIPGVQYNDTVITDMEDSKSSYFLPIDGENQMKPNTEYTMSTKFGKVGFNDVTLVYDKKFSFQTYLLGSVFETVDDGSGTQTSGAWTIEQVAELVNVPYSKSVSIPTEKMNDIRAIERKSLIHKFKSSDGVELYNRLDSIIDLD